MMREPVTIMAPKVIACLLVFQLCVSTLIRAQDAPTKYTHVHADGSKLLQRFDGVGVNANTRSWDEAKLQPALDLLIDYMHSAIWRVIAETVDDWETENDNSDPFTFNWNYYNKLYETSKFQKVWNTLGYLNKRGITENIIINFMGFAPRWMGEKIIEPKFEDEYVEMVVSFYHYALKTKGLKFGYISPTNESDHHNFSEGPHLTGEQHAEILNKIIRRMQELQLMDGIKVIAPDNASPGPALKEFIPAMMRDSLIMQHSGPLGFHSYSGHIREVPPFIKSSHYPDKSYWITEWNAWCNGCDDGILGEYNYPYAKKSVSHLISLLKGGAGACLLWEAYDSYYSHHAPSLFSYWGVLEYNPDNKTYHPRKHFYAIQQVSRFLKPGMRQLGLQQSGDSLLVFAAIDSLKKELVIAGVNSDPGRISLQLSVENIGNVQNVQAVYTDSISDLQTIKEITINGDSVTVLLPPDCIFTIHASLSDTTKNKEINQSAVPEKWYAGDIHVHRNCGTDSIVPEKTLLAMMENNNLSVVSLLADMGNGEVKPSVEDLQKVNGKPSPVSTSNRIIQWDTEWHWDATYNQFGHQALGGHLVLLGLKKAKQIWEESPWRILDWAKKQDAIRGFAHFQYLADTVQNQLNCCIPIDYPVEAALGNIDFVSEDVLSGSRASLGEHRADAAINAYYKLLNCGFKIGFAAGTDYPCNSHEPLGSLLTYVHVDGELTYRKWVEGIRYGKTVVSRNGNREFLDFKVDGNKMPGSEISVPDGRKFELEVKWNSASHLSGVVEIVHNGKVIDSIRAVLKPGESAVLKSRIDVRESGWVCARRMDENGHQLHTAPVYFKVAGKPVRASKTDALFFVSWMDNLLDKIKPGGEWNHYFDRDLKTIKRRYLRARHVYQKIADESK